MDNNLNIAVEVSGDASPVQMRALEIIIECNKSCAFSLYFPSGNADAISIFSAYPNTRIVDNLEEWNFAVSVCNKAIYIGLDGKIPSEEFLNSLYSSEPKELTFIDEAGIVTNDAKCMPEGERLLFVFPGPIIPLNSGSHQRAFNLLINMKRSGFAIDALITLPKGAKKDGIVSALRLLCSNVYIYKNRAKKIPEPLSTIRWVEQKINVMRGKGRQLPDTFTERAFLKPTESCKRWVNSLFVAKEYKKIIVSYAWMLDCVKYIEHRRSEYKLICDSHDVQFIRNEKILTRGVRPFFSRQRDKNAEIKRLEKCDAVIAISVSDEKILKNELRKAKVVKASPGFDYALVPARRRPAERPFSFGFIGGKMEANVIALRHIVEAWWPAIKLYSPDSTLYVAGSVSLTPDIRQASFFDEKIVCMGFVDNLSDFYSKIDVALNPVVVQGGLNFKSVEAVFAGKDLITNELGLECLGEGFPAYAAASGNDIVAHIRENEFAFDADRRRRLTNQEKAKSMFKNAKAFERFLAYLHSDFR